jgi:hypothetical protein
VNSSHKYGIVILALFFISMGVGEYLRHEQKMECLKHNPAKECDK